MRAVVVQRPGVVEVVDRPIPAPDKGQVRLRVAAAGICGTDRHIVQGEFPATLPRVLGHEVVGIIDDPGDTPFRGGEHVVVDPNMPCHDCEQCRASRVHLCTNRDAIGINWDGGFEEYLVVPAAQLYHLGSTVPIQAGVLAEPLSCCIHGIDQLRLDPSMNVAIVGLGPIGLLLVMLLQMNGIRQIIAIDSNEKRRQQAARLGVTAYAWENAAVQQMDRTVQVVIDAVGLGRVLEWGLQALTRGGQLLVFGVARPDDVGRISPYLLYEKELTIVSAHTNPFTMQRAVHALHTDAIDVMSLLTDPIRIEDMPEALTIPPQGLKSYLVFKEALQCR